MTKTNSIEAPGTGSLARRSDNPKKSPCELELPVLVSLAPIDGSTVEWTTVPVLRRLQVVTRHKRLTSHLT